MGAFMSEEDQQALWELRKTWVGLYSVTYTGRWHARRIGGDDRISASTAPELGQRIQADYAAKVFHQ
jgi:hypothetical protein